MIENIILFKITMIVYKVIVYSEVPDFDCWASNNRFQINCLCIAVSRIYFNFVHQYLIFQGFYHQIIMLAFGYCLKSELAIYLYCIIGLVNR